MIHIKKIFGFITDRRPWIVILSLAVLGLVAGGYVYYRFEASHIRQEKYREIATIAELKDSQIEQWRKERLGDTLRTARSSFFREAVVRWMRDPADIDLQSALRERLRLELEAYGYSDALVLDTDGRILLAAHASPDPVDAAAKRALQIALASRTAVLSDLYRCPHGIVHLDAVAPILNVKGQAVAVVLLHCNAEAFLYPLIRSWPTPSSTAETLLVRRDGDDVLFLNELRHQPGTTLALRLPLTKTDVPAAQAVLGRQGMFQGRDYRGSEVLADMRPVPGSPWFMVAKVDTQEILAEVRYRAGVISLVVFLSILLVAGTIVYIYRSQQEAERKRSEEALRESEERFRRFSAAAFEAIIIHEGGILISANDQFYKMHGYAPEELVGKQVIPLTIAPEVLESARKHIATGSLESYESIGLKKDETRFPIEIRGREVEYEGRKVRVAAIMDITERKQAENALRESEERFRRFSAAAFEAIIIHEEGILISANDQYYEMFGYEPKDLTGKQAMPLTIAPEALESTRKHIATGGLGPYETVGLKKDGTTFPIEIRVREWEHEGRKVRVAAIMDITKRKQAEEEIRKLNAELELRVRQRTAQLESANKDLESFSYSVSHDLRAPLRAISGFADIVARRHRADLNEEGQHYVDNIVLASERMGHLIDDLLQYSRLGRSSVHRERVPLREVFASLASDLAARLAETGGTLSIADDLPTVMGDRTLLSQVFANLLENAITYRQLDVPVHVTVSCQTEDKNSIICVDDNGIGIPTEYYEKIFNIFQRLHSDDEYPGTGIGLATVKKSAELLGGQVWVESVTGEGSKFFVQLQKE